MKLTNTFIILIILTAAAILRFYNYFEIPFTHDEFSALFRLNFDSFSELIEKGVKIDGHPAGIQVFLYYWTKLFGTQEWIVKLPFIIAGIGAVYLIYVIGRNWFNETVGLISAAYMATIQFAVMHSQIARPYISGLFFSLLMVYYLSNLILKPPKDFNKNLILFVIAASLCSYNHHFSLLFAVIAGISGVFLIKKEFLVKYLLAGLMIFVLYIPHLKIFFYQLNIGGIEGWLGKPQNDFLIQFIYYIFNYSFFVITITLAIVLFGIFGFEKKKLNYKFIILSFIWFILPFLIGFLYSRYVNAVLQFSVLIFTFPFLFFVLFGFMKKQSTKINLILVLIILLTNTLTLIYGRKHYEIFYNSVYKGILIDHQTLNDKYENLVSVIDSHEKITDYYINKYDYNSDFTFYAESFQEIKDFKHFLKSESKKHYKLYFGCLSSVHPNLVPLIQEYFPVIEIKNNYFGGTTYLFSKGNFDDSKTIGNLDFASEISENWGSIDTSKIKPLPDASGKYYYSMTSDVEWGPLFSIPLNDVIHNRNNFIDISADAKLSDFPEGIILVASLESNGEIIHWGGTDFSDFYLPTSYDNHWQRFHHSVKLSDVNLNRRNILLKVYIWNKAGNDIMIDNFRISLREGNPIIYGLIEKF